MSNIFISFTKPTVTYFEFSVSILVTAVTKSKQMYLSPSEQDF